MTTRISKYNWTSTYHDPVAKTVFKSLRNDLARSLKVLRKERNGVDYSDGIAYGICLGKQTALTMAVCDYNKDKFG